MKSLEAQLTIQGNHVLLIGNRSYKNMGDELILVGTIKLLQQQGKKISIQAYDPKWLEGFLKQFVDTSALCFLREIPKGIRSFFRFLMEGGLAELWKYRSIDAVIVGGGEILTEENPNSYWYWLISLIPSLIRKLFMTTNIYLMGGIQIPKKNQNLWLFRFLLKQTYSIYVRDFDAFGALKEFGYSRVEFFMDTAYFAWDWEKITPHPYKKHYILVNINGNGEQFLPEIMENIRQYVSSGYDIFYVPIGKGINKEYNDLQYYSRLCKESTIDILDWEYDFEHFLQVVKGADMVFSTRLHLFLIASFLGVPTKVYPYQKKIIKMQSVLQKVLPTD